MLLMLPRVGNILTTYAVSVSDIGGFIEYCVIFDDPHSRCSRLIWNVFSGVEIFFWIRSGPFVFLCELSATYIVPQLCIDMGSSLWERGPFSLDIGVVLVYPYPGSVC